MNPNPDERGSTRPKTLLLLIGLILLGGLAMLWAQGLKVTGVKEIQPGQIAIEYQNQTPGRVRVLQGSTVTNIVQQLNGPWNEERGKLWSNGRDELSVA